MAIQQADWHIPAPYLSLLFQGSAQSIQQAATKLMKQAQRWQPTALLPFRRSPEPSIQYSKRMSSKSAVKLPNSVKVSEFGLTFLKHLPAELQDLQESNQSKQNLLHDSALQRRGAGLDFQCFANQTQTLLKRQTFCKFAASDIHSSESKRKLQLHYSNWVSEQKLLRHKIADSLSRLEQAKYSEYDWRAVSSNLKQRSRDVLGEWSEAYACRNMRRKDKLAKLLARNYPRQP